jgi:hypothetical protein
VSWRCKVGTGKPKLVGRHFTQAQLADPVNLGYAGVIERLCNNAFVETTAVQGAADNQLPMFHPRGAKP